MSRIGPPTVWALLAAWVGILVIASLRIEQAVFGDPGFGMFAAEQWRQALSPSMRVLVEADPRNLARSVQSVVSWWPPAYQAVPLFVRQLTDCSWGGAVRATVWLAWASGLAGWGLYFRLVASRSSSWVWLLLVFATARYGHVGFDKYDGGGNLILGSFPWVLLLNVQALVRPSATLAALAGAMGAALFLVKYSGLIDCVALGAAWLSLSLPRPSIRTLCWPAAYAAGAVAAYSTVHVLGIPGGANPIDATPRASSVVLLLYPFTMLPLAVTDLDSLVRFLFIHPNRAWLAPLTKWIVGAPLLLAAVAVLRGSARGLSAAVSSDPRRTAAARCTLALVLVAPFVLGLILARGGLVDENARHMRLEALAALPWVFLVLASGLRAAARSTRIACRITLVALVVAPCAYGAATLLDKAFVRPDGPGLVALSGIRQDLLGPHGNAPALISALRALRSSPDTVLYVTSSSLALELADRRLIVRTAEVMSPQTLGAERFVRCPRGGVLALLPKTFESNGKGQIIRRAFLDVADWQELMLPGRGALNVFQGRCVPQGG